MSRSTVENEELSDLQVEQVVAGMDKGSQEQVVRNRYGVVKGTVIDGQRFDRYGRFKGTIG